MSAAAEKKIIIIAGPNGAGKTTFAEEYLPREAGWRNFKQLYQPLVNEWALYDNSGPVPTLLDEGIHP